jgi:conjugal transfer pilin signal peptidase TrbI
MAEFKARGKRLSVEFCSALWRWKVTLIFSVSVVLGISQFLALGFNVTKSLPQKVFLVLKWRKDLFRGEYVAFRWHGLGPYPKGVTFVKMVKGLPGDQVDVKGREVFVNGDSAGVAKLVSRAGLALEVGRAGVIPPGRFYAFAPSADSLDSRYALTGWIDQAEVIGQAIPLF